MSSPRPIAAVGRHSWRGSRLGCRRSGPNAFGAQTDWYSLPIRVVGLPAGATDIPVAVNIDFTAALEELNARGAVDERSLRFYRLEDGGAIREIPYQFSATPQPRVAQRALLPGTVPEVSYLAEFAAGERPEPLRVAGQLAWMIEAGTAQTAAHYRLDFGVRRKGRAVQVPFAPQNLRMFEDDGRSAPARWFPAMQIRPQWPHEGVLHIYENNELVTSYHLGLSSGQTSGGFRRPFFYPVFGPDGAPLTELGKPHDPSGSHAHHYSLWIAHADVNGVDFWSERGGVIAHDELELLEDGPVFCRVRQKARWVASGTPIVLDRREFTIYRAAPDFRLIDVDLILAPASGPVTFGKTTFGFLAARVAQSMTVFDGGGEILNARGDRNEQGAHLKRAEWIDQAGPVRQDRWNGLAMFDHPHNPNYPTGWHCRNDGWAGAAFNQFAATTLNVGEALRLRYRLCLHRGTAKEARLAARYAEFTATPSITLGAAVRGAGAP
jgi:hypothetical protein